jgi:hypothetical protein
VIGVAYRHRTDAVRLGPRDRLVRGPHRQHLADAIVAVQHGNRARVDHDLGGGDRVHHTMAEAVEVPAEPEHPVGLMAPQVGLYQRVRHQPGIGRGHTRAGIDRRDEVDETRGVDARTHAHDVSLTWLALQRHLI